MTDTPHTLWMAASTRPLDEIESMRCEAPECEIVQEFRAAFNEIHRLRAIIDGRSNGMTLEERADAISAMNAAICSTTLADRTVGGQLEVALSALLERFTLVRKP